jgi:hypothetical protein
MTRRRYYGPFLLAGCSPHISAQSQWSFVSANSTSTLTRVLSVSATQSVTQHCDWDRANPATSSQLGITHPVVQLSAHWIYWPRRHWLHFGTGVAISQAKRPEGLPQRTQGSATTPSHFPGQWLDRGSLLLQLRKLQRGSGPAEGRAEGFMLRPPPPASPGSADIHHQTRLGNPHLLGRRYFNLIYDVIFSSN